jgi:hypothetical protein
MRGRKIMVDMRSLEHFASGRNRRSNTLTFKMRNAEIEESVIFVSFGDVFFPLRLCENSGPQRQDSSELPFPNSSEYLLAREVAG